MSGIQDLFKGMRISSSGLTAERTRMDIIAQNIANATTHSADGSPYQRMIVEFAPILQKAEQFGMPDEVLGVEASRILPDTVTPFEEILDPSHPHADLNGRVLLPNVNAVLEMTDMISSMRAYEANLTAQEGYVRMAERVLQIAR